MDDVRSKEQTDEWWERIWMANADAITEEVRHYVVALGDGKDALGSGLLALK